MAGGESQNTLTGLICHCTTYFKIKSVWFLVLGKAGDGKTVVDNASEKLMPDDAFENGDYERVYRELRESEKKSEEMLLQFNQAYPGELKGENIGTILEKARQKRKKGDTEK